MATTIIKEVKTATDLKNFIRFPMELYNSNECYVPPLIKDEMKTWNAKDNPALAYSEAKLFLAYQDNILLGRVAVIINHKEEKELGVRKVRFGWLDFVDESSVSEALINTVIEFAKAKNIHQIEGPMGFTNLDKAGLLIKGFNKLATMIGLYNGDYYSTHLENLGLTKAKEWVEYEIQFPESLPDKVLKFSNLIAEKYKLKVLNFKNKQEITPLVEPMFDLLDKTYSALSTYTPLSEEQKKTYIEKYFPFIKKDYIICIEDENHDLVAFAITMPSYSKALQKANGQLFPLGWWHFLQAGKKNDRANFYLIGIHPDYQRRGVTAIIFKEIFERFAKIGIRYMETNPELEENKNIQLLWQDYEPVNHKRRRTYAKTLS